jgi:protein subunit release factor B
VLSLAERLHALVEREAEFSAMRAQGAGGQNVNKVSSAVHLRFDVARSSLSDAHKARVLALNDQRIGEDGVLVVKAQEHRSQVRNREAAIDRVVELLASVAHAPRKRVATKPTYGSKQRRLEGKSQRSEIKAGRSKRFD